MLLFDPCSPVSSKIHCKRPVEVAPTQILPNLSKDVDNFLSVVTKNQKECQFHYRLGKPTSYIFVYVRKRNINFINETFKAHEFQLKRTMYQLKQRNYASAHFRLPKNAYTCNDKCLIEVNKWIKHKVIVHRVRHCI